MTQRPVTIDPELVMCRWHGESFRAAWPLGFIVFALHLVQASIAKLPPGAAPSAIASEDARHQALEAALRRHAPLCCWLDAATRLEAYREADQDHYEKGESWAKDGVCELCRKPGRGTTFQVIWKPGAAPQELSHVCFSCVATKIYSRAAPRGRRAA